MIQLQSLKTRGLALTALVALLPGAAFAQSADTSAGGQPSAFLIADVHVSPHTLQPFPRSTFHNDRYTMRQASMVDLIASAYSVDANNILGGPSWLETDHFDIYANAPPKTSSDTVKLMLRTLLADRFKLVLHTDSKPLPAFVLSAGKGEPKLTPADTSVDSNCKYVDPPPNLPQGTVPYITFTCHNTTMATFAENIHNWAGGYLTSPVVDSTGLKGSWDFDIKWTGKGGLARAGADGISIFDAVDKQLGLKLEAKTAPLPVVIVDSAIEKPTPNPPGVDKALPPPPPAEFDVATIRPSSPDAKGLNGRVQGSQVSLQNGTLKFLIAFAYDVTDEMLVNAPKWFDTDHFDINAKAAVDPTPGAPQMDPDDLRQMVRKFLADRFQLKVHREDRPLDAYTLIATSSPKLKKADPANRTGCKEGPGADGKDPRIANPILGRLLTCRNMTLSQFAAVLQNQANGYIHTPVLDATGIDGAYDITLSFSSSGQLPNGGAPPPTSDAGNAPAASDPSGAVSLIDAINKQLGLKLVKQKRPVPALVIDSVEEKPTEN